MKLKDEQRKDVRIRLLASYTPKEIKADTGISLPTIRKIREAAKKELYEDLKEYGDYDERIDMVDDFVSVNSENIMRILKLLKRRANIYSTSLDRDTCWQEFEDELSI